MNNKIFKKIIFFSIFSNQVKAFKIFDKEINPKLIIGTTLFIGCAGFVYKKIKDQKYLLENDLNLKKDTIKKLEKEKIDLNLKTITLESEIKNKIYFLY